MAKTIAVLGVTGNQVCNSSPLMLLPPLLESRTNKHRFSPGGVRSQALPRPGLARSRHHALGQQCVGRPARRRGYLDRRGGPGRAGHARPGARGRRGNFRGHRLLGAVLRGLPRALQGLGPRDRRARARDRGPAGEEPRRCRGEGPE